MNLESLSIILVIIVLVGSVTYLLDRLVCMVYEWDQQRRRSRDHVSRDTVDRLLKQEWNE